MATAVETLSLAQEHQDAGRLAEAEIAYRQVIAESTDSSQLADAYDGLAAVLQDRGEIDQAIAASLRVVELRADPDEAYALGDTLARMQRDEAAIKAFALATQFNPHFAEAHARLGGIWFAKREVQRAIDSYRRAVDAKPDLAEAHCNLASALHEAGDDDGALESARRAVAVKPNLAEAHNILGVVLKDRYRLADAATQFLRAVELKPDYAEAINNIGSVLEQLGRFGQASNPYEQAVALRPQSASFHENLAHNLLLRGDFARGWAEHEWRRRNPKNAASRNFGVPMWDGSDLAGKTILLHAEQRIADTIQFCRYIPMVRERGGKIIVECQESIAPVIAGIEGVERVIEQGHALQGFDRHCPLLSLPLVFATTLDNVPAAMPYIGAEAGRVSNWSAKLPARDGKLRVGLTWAANPRHKNDRNRCCPPSLLEPLQRTGEVVFVSLQKNSTTRPGDSLALLDFTDELHDFADTAALIAQLNLVITVDTAVAHLAGAMGKAVWVMIPSFPDWRWMIDREDSPWYPTMKLFRQTSAGDWRGVVERISSALPGEIQRHQANVSSKPPLESPA